ncbi:unnamed protein product [Lepeophtheirus salmonis]|uniref:(salmon louse) hypothetical protein n=1 Tax=Lepeophtheirus salmonis TaxID=72036 RepID=A0A7R8GZF6_LEPSM|nr:unnamed protein product [Lepeophtheirus salmonis]CAF2763593.1 unnamed protein product [Lepeophtheirus salmonis]
MEKRRKIYSDETVKAVIFMPFHPDKIREELQKNPGGGNRRISKSHSLLESELRRSPLANASNSGVTRNNSCLNCKLIIMGESISYADGRCPQCGDDQEQRRLK